MHATTACPCSTISQTNISEFTRFKFWSEYYKIWRTSWWNACNIWVNFILLNDTENHSSVIIVILKRSLQDFRRIVDTCLLCDDHRFWIWHQTWGMIKTLQKQEMKTNKCSTESRRKNSIGVAMRRSMINIMFCFYIQI